MTLKEELKHYWNKSKLHIYHLGVGFALALVITGAFGGLATIIAISYLIGMLFVKKN